MGETFNLPARIRHITSPTHPEIRFEWHPATRKLYVIRVGAIPEQGELIATTGVVSTAEALCDLYLKGYAEGKTATVSKRPPIKIAG